MTRLLSFAIIGFTSMGLLFANATQSQAQTPLGVQVQAGPVGISAGIVPTYPVYAPRPAPVIVQPSVVYAPAPYPVYSVAPSVVIRPGIVWRGGYYYGHRGHR